MTDQTLTVHPLLDGWWFIAILAIPGIYILWQEYNRAIRFRFLRMVAAFLVLASIATLFLRPAVKMEKELSVVLLTEGYKKEHADSLYRTNKDLQFYHLPNAAPYSHSVKLASINDITPLATKIRLVLGNGLPEFAWKQLTRSNYIPGNLPSGITAIRIPDQVYTNRESILRGTYAIPTDEKVTVALRSPAGVEDSVTFTTRGVHSFKLSFTARQAGNFIYELVVRQADETQVEPLPIVVRTDIPYKTLFLQQQPTFENQYLKSFLTDKNHSVVLRSQLSRSIFRYEYINHPSVQINALSQKTLSGFDLVIMDSETLQSISTAEIKTLKEAVESGLGLLILMHEQPNSRNITTFVPWKAVSLKTDTTSITLASGKTTSLAVAPFVFTECISSLQSILQNKRGVLAGFNYAGTGKVGFQLLQSTYPLVLQGDTIAYSKLWSPILEQLARRRSAANFIQIKSTFPIYPYQPIDIALISTDATPVLQDDSIALPLAEDVRIDNIWHATTWAGNPGWHILSAADSVQLPYYVSADNAWRSLQAANMINLSQLRSIDKKEISDSKYIAYTPVAPLIFFITLLVSLGFLWLAPKL